MKRDTIIIFEDNAIDRSILVELFRSEYKILEAENGKVGIELLKNNLASVAIVLLDNVMPVMDGFAVLEYLKERNIVNKIPFIMITGDSSPRFMRALNPEVKVVCAHPVKGHYIQGLKNMEEAIVPDIYDPSRIDIQQMTGSEEAITMARRIIAEEGIFAGMSSGAAMLAACRTAESIDSGNIVVIFPDRAEKYLSTVMFADVAD